MVSRALLMLPPSGGGMEAPRRPRRTRMRPPSALREAPKRPPRGPKWAPSGPPEAPGSVMSAKVGSKRSPDEPNAGPERPPRGPQDASKRPQEASKRPAEVFKTPQGAQEAFDRLPRGLPCAPRGPIKPARRKLHDHTNNFHDAPRRRLVLQEASKRPPRGPQEAPKGRQTLLSFT